MIYRLTIHFEYYISAFQTCNCRGATFFYRFDYGIHPAINSYQTLTCGFIKSRSDGDFNWSSVTQDCHMQGLSAIHRYDSLQIGIVLDFHIIDFGDYVACSKPSDVCRILDVLFCVAADSAAVFACEDDFIGYSLDLRTHEGDNCRKYNSEHKVHNRSRSKNANPSGRGCGIERTFFLWKRGQVLFQGGFKGIFPFHLAVPTQWKSRQLPFCPASFCRE